MVFPKKNILDPVAEKKSAIWDFEIRQICLFKDMKEGWKTVRIKLNDMSHYSLKKRRIYFFVVLVYFRVILTLKYNPSVRYYSHIIKPCLYFITDGHTAGDILVQQETMPY